MKKLSVLLVVVFACAFFHLETQAQVLDGVYVKEHDPVRNPIPYTSLREADVMWSKKIIRQIDLKEKMNHPLYFPTKEMSDRRSLIQLIIWGFENASKTAYDFNDTYEIVNPIPTQQAMRELGDKIDSIIDNNGVFQGMDTSRAKEKSYEVQAFLLKEEWFFDKQRSVMDVRIIGICPIRYAENTQTNKIDRRAACWIYFPEFRDLLSKQEVFNVKNDAERRTFDDIFWKRKFSSYIIKESNVYNDRTVANYTLGLEAMLEGEKIKDFIFKVEHDLWEY